MNQTLKDAMPHQFLGGEYNDTSAYKLRDMKVAKVYSNGEPGWKRWPGLHKNVHLWVELENGKMVGWNENPARGWSFPVIGKAGK